MFPITTLCDDGWKRNRFLLRRCCNALEQAAHGGGEVTVSGAVVVVVPRNVVSGHGGGWLTVGLGDFGSLFQP